MQNVACECFRNFVDSTLFVRTCKGGGTPTLKNFYNHSGGAMNRLVVLLCTTLMLSGLSFAQGVTTASMTGLVTTEQGEPVPGANVIAVHEPTGTRYGAPTRVNGQYDIQNMRIGGPYTVTFSHTGYNTVTKSGTNEVMGSLYNFYRNADLVGNSVRGNKAVANPTLAFHQSGFTLSGPIVPNTLFFFMKGEVVRREDPASDFAANHGQSGFGISRVRASTMDSIRQRMLDVYGYDPGPYEGYNHSTDNDKFLAKLDWNLNEDNNVTLRFDYLNGRRELGPHPFVLSYRSE